MSKEIITITNLPDLAKQLQAHQIQSRDNTARRAGGFVVLTTVLAASILSALHRPQTHYEPVNSASIPITRTLDSGTDPKDEKPQESHADLKAEQIQLISLLRGILSSPNSEVREAASAIYSEVTFTNGRIDNTSTKLAMVAIVRRENDDEYTILASQELFSKGFDTQQVKKAQRQLYESHLILNEARNSPGRYKRDVEFTADVEKRAETASQQLFPQIAQGHDR